MNDQELWQAQIGLQDAHRSERYFTWIAERNRWWHVGTSLATTIGAVIASVFAGMEFARGDSGVLAIVALFAGLAASIASTFSVVFNFSARSSKAATLAKESSLTISEWRSLLISANGDGAARLVDLSKRQKEIEAPVSSELPLKRRLNKRAESAAYDAVLYEIHHKTERRCQNRRESRTQKNVACLPREFLRLYRNRSSRLRPSLRLSLNRARIEIMSKDTPPPKPPETPPDHGGDMEERREDASIPDHVSEGSDADATLPSEGSEPPLPDPPQPSDGSSEE